MMRTLRVELLVGCRIVDRSGVFVGRLHDIEVEGDEVRFVLTGVRGFLERLWGLHRIWRRRPGYRIRWDQLDWEECGPLTLLCDVAALEKM